jgi:ABC-type branched-subunit amino acid transport system substrate-binding protein
VSRGTCSEDIQQPLDVWGKQMVAKKFKLLTAFTAVALLVGACGNSGDDGGSSDTTAAGETTTTAGGSGGDRDTFVSIEGVPGVSDTEIKVAAIGTLSNNPLGTNILNAYVDGIKAYFEWRNDEGGIYGRKLVVDQVLDDALSKNKDQATAVCAGKKAFAAFVATLLYSGNTTLNDCGIPSFNWGIHAKEISDQPYLFGTAAPACVACPTPAPAWVAREMGVTKVAVVGYGVSENSKLSAQNTAKSIEQYAPEIEVAYFDDSLAFGLPNGIAPQVSQMKEAGVQMVFTAIDLNGMKTLGLELNKQGMQDVILSHPNTYNQTFVKENADLFEGDVVTVPFVPFEAEIDSETQRKFVEYTDKLGIKAEELTMDGWISADEFFTGLLGAGPNFTQAAVKDALRAITDYSAGGLIAPQNLSTQVRMPTPEDPVTNGPEQLCTAMVQIKNGAFELFSGEPGKPFACWPNPTTSLDEGPTATSFAG